MEARLGEAEAAPNGRGGRRAAGQALHGLPDEREAAERGYDEREATEDREQVEDDRLEFFLDSLQQSVLPDLPYMAGYHVCWLTTSNPRDSIQWRRRIGYELIRLEELPGWEGITLKSGDYQGVVGINEMVAARIPLRLYNRLMQAVHHDAPLAEEGKLRARIDLMKQQASQMGSVVDEGDGTAAIVQRARPMAEFDS